MDDDIRPKALLIPFDKFVVLDMLNPVQYKRTITSMRRYVEFGEEPSRKCTRRADEKAQYPRPQKITASLVGLTRGVP